jgi:hypothetical protein
MYQVHYTNGVGFQVNGELVSANKIAMLTADHLDYCASVLRWIDADNPESFTQNNLDADALESTANYIRESDRAKRTLRVNLTDVEAMTAPATAPQATADWLATLDHLDALKRSDLPTLYTDAGRPGALSDAQLRQAASARWGDPRKRRGIYVYTPSASH